MRNHPDAAASGPTNLDDVVKGLASGTINDESVHRMLDSVAARTQESVERLCLLVNLLFRGDNQLPPTLVDDLVEVCLDFPFNLEEQRSGSIMVWDEPAIAMRLTCELLLGQKYPDGKFGCDARTGVRHEADAAKALTVWLSDKFRFGFTNWLSAKAYTQITAALTLLAEFAASSELSIRAAMVLDLLLADLALHSFKGWLSTSSANPLGPNVGSEEDDLFLLFRSAFSDQPAVTLNLDELISIFMDRRNYQVPEVLVSIAKTSDQLIRVKESFGLDVSEVETELTKHPTQPRTSATDRARVYWAMHAFVNPESIRTTVAARTKLALPETNPFDRLKVVRKVPNALLPTLVKSLNPVQTGAAIQRANVQTFKTPNYALSSAQRYHPGEFGAKERIWQATLSGRVKVFGNHPRKIGVQIGSSDEEWLGNQVLPDVAQNDSVLLAIYDTSVRSGLHEGSRAKYSQLYFPFVQFDETKLGPHFVAGRSGNAYIGVLSIKPLEMVSDNRIVQRGEITCYAVMMADTTEYANLSQFANQIKYYYFRFDGRRLSLTTAYSKYRLEWGGEFTVDGIVKPSQYQRLESVWVQASRNPNRIYFAKDNFELDLNWADGTRILN